MPDWRKIIGTTCDLEINCSLIGWTAVSRLYGGKYLTRMKVYGWRNMPGQQSAGSEDIQMRLGSKAGPHWEGLQLLDWRRGSVCVIEMIKWCFKIILWWHYGRYLRKRFTVEWPNLPICWDWAVSWVTEFLVLKLGQSSENRYLLSLVETRRTVWRLCLESRYKVTRQILCELRGL